VADGDAKDASAFEAAGLYDRNAPDAADRLTLLRYLAAKGATIAQMVAAPSITGLAADLTLRPGARYTARQVAARHGMSVDQVLALSLAVGLPPGSPDDAVYADEDAVVFALFNEASTLFGADATRRFVRVVGSSLARIAEAAVTLFQVNVEGPLLAAGGTPVELARENLRAIGSLDGVRQMLQALFTVHMEQAIRRLREAQPRSSVDTATFAVGFVDLVSYTTLAHRMSARELAQVIERFEETAYDVVTAHAGRVVKLVGDEVMFVARAPRAACDIALTLVERFAGDSAVTPRGGLAHGEVLLRGGDYYGPIVNLASRVAQIAVPNELLVTPAVASGAAGHFRFEPAGKRMLKGFDEPVALLTVARRQ